MQSIKLRHRTIDSRVWSALFRITILVSLVTGGRTMLRISCTTRFFSFFVCCGYTQRPETGSTSLALPYKRSFVYMQSTTSGLYHQQKVRTSTDSFVQQRNGCVRPDTVIWQNRADLFIAIRISDLHLAVLREPDGDVHQHHHKAGIVQSVGANPCSTPCCFTHCAPYTCAMRSK